MIEGFDLFEMIAASLLAVFAALVGLRGYRRRQDKRSSVDATNTQPPSEPTPMEREHATTDAAIRESDKRATAGPSGDPVDGSDPGVVAAGRDWLADDKPNG